MAVANRAGRTTRARGMAVALFLAAGIGTGLLAQSGAPPRGDLAKKVLW